jgi:hypothetical protein
MASVYLYYLVQQVASQTAVRTQTIFRHKEGEVTEYYMQQNSEDVKKFVIAWIRVAGAHSKLILQTGLPGGLL